MIRLRDGIEIDETRLAARPVDLIPRHALHWVIRDEVLATARPVPVA